MGGGKQMQIRVLERYWIHNENHETKTSIIACFMPSCDSESLIKTCFLNWNLRIICQILLFVSKLKWKTLGVKSNFSTV